MTEGNNQQKANKPFLILVRGLPGSGKTTFAKSLAKDHVYVHIESDDYFMKNGKYEFDPKSLSDAHHWCYSKAIASLRTGTSCVISNTFTRNWEMQKYFDFAKDNNIPIIICEMRSQYESTHNVPVEVMERMRDRWEKVSFTNSPCVIPLTSR